MSQSCNTASVSPLTAPAKSRRRHRDFVERGHRDEPGDDPQVVVPHHPGEKPVNEDRVWQLRLVPVADMADDQHYPSISSNAPVSESMMNPRTMMSFGTSGWVSQPFCATKVLLYSMIWSIIISSSSNSPQK